jgi:hypothetical protein
MQPLKIAATAHHKFVLTTQAGRVNRGIQTSWSTTLVSRGALRAS